MPASLTSYWAFPGAGTVIGSPSTTHRTRAGSLPARARRVDIGATRAALVSTEEGRTGPDPGPRMSARGKVCFKGHGKREMGHIEIVTIGDELVEGRLIDTNAGELSERLTREGFTVARHLSVGDRRDHIIAVLRECAGRADAVVVTGGLGPTTDDLTAACAAEAFGRDLVRFPDALDHVRRFFAERSRPMAPTNEKQADLPAGATILPNPNGTAVGFRLQAEGCGLYFMPGVPRELHPMFEASVLPALRAHVQREAPQVATLKVFGMGESDVGQSLQGLGDDLEPPARLKVQYRATFPEIQVRLLLYGMQGETATRRLQGLADDAHRRLGGHVFALSEETSFAQLVVDELRRKGATLAICEGFTAGQVTLLLHGAEHASEVFAGGEVAALPGDDAETAATSIRQRRGATLGLGVVLGEQGDTFTVAVASAAGVSRRDLRFPLDTARLRRLAAYVALAQVRQALAAGS